MGQTKQERQGEPFAVNVIAGLWRGFDVVVSPPSTQHRMRHFADHAEAIAFAEELGRVTGWPVRDRTANDG